MIEAIAKNLWMLITIVLPGMFTYGLWRLLLLLHTSATLDTNALEQVDNSYVITWCLIVAIALLQQSIGLMIEFALYSLSRRKKDDRLFKKLFYQRFLLAQQDKLKGYSSNVIGNFFLSLNIFIGIVFLFVYFLLYEKVAILHWIPLTLTFFAGVLLVNLIFRYKTSIQIIREI